MKCPLCAAEMEPGQVAVPALHTFQDMGKFLGGQEGRHCLFTPLDDGQEEKHVVVPHGAPRPAYHCSECEVAIVWGPNWTVCPKCHAPINPTTGRGLTSPEDEPWLMLCTQCQAEIEPDL